jgi:hypothetical protein
LPVKKFAAVPRSIFSFRFPATFKRSPRKAEIRDQPPVAR